jgi:hypothetical protein
MERCPPREVTGVVVSEPGSSESRAHMKVFSQVKPGIMSHADYK